MCIDLKQTFLSNQNRTMHFSDQQFIAIRLLLAKVDRFILLLYWQGIAYKFWYTECKGYIRNIIVQILFASFVTTLLEANIFAV